jgi:AcrR family transcriptional regulator
MVASRVRQMTRGGHEHETGSGHGGDPVTLPWWPSDRTEHGGRDPLTRRRIIEAAIRIIDAEGLDALSMRRLGQELGAGATSIYWHVANKDQLLDLVLDEIMGEVASEVRGAGGWCERLTDAARAVRRVLGRHPNASVLLGERPTIGPNALDALELVLSELAAAGFDRRSAMLTVNTVVNFAAGWAVFECRKPAGELAEGKSPEELGELLHTMMISLPAGRYPNLVASAGEIVGIGTDEQFEFALQAIIEGVGQARERVLAAARSAAPGDRTPGAT